MSRWALYLLIQALVVIPNAFADSTCQRHLSAAAVAVDTALSELGLPVPPALSRSIPCYVDVEEGCNAIWNGSLILLYSGGSRCRRAADMPAMILHEYGHALADGLIRSYPPAGQYITEAVGDVTAALLTGSPRIAEGFWLNRQISWLRDISDAKVYPGHFAGTYTASLILSSAWWKVRNALLLAAGPEQGPKIAFRAFIGSLPRIKILEEDHFQPTAAARAAVESLLAEPAVRARPELACTIRTIFSSHGLLAAPTDCLALPPHEREPIWDRTLEVDLLAGGKPVRITDGGAKEEGPWAKIPFEFRLDAREKLVNAALELKTTHSFSDDLLIGWQDADGKIREVFKGEEEIPLPERIAITSLLSARRGHVLRGHIVIRDLAPMYTGTVTKAILHLGVVRL